MKDDRFLLVLMALLGFASFLVLQPFLTYILFSVIFAVVFYPLYEKLKSVLKFAPLSATVIIILIIILVVAPSVYFTITIFAQTRDIVSNLSTVEFASLKTFERWISTAFGVEVNVAENIRSSVVDLSEAIKSTIRGNIITYTRAVTNFIGGMVLMFFVMFYLFVDGKQIVQQVKKQFPIEEKYKNHLFLRAYHTVQALFLGLFFTAVIQGALSTLGYFLFGVPNALFWGFVTGIFSLLPFFGPPVIYIPASLFLLSQGNIFTGIGLLIYGIILISNVDNVVRPQLVRMRVNVHPLTIILGVVGGVVFIGFSGIVIGPLILALFAETVKTYQLVKKRR